MKSFSNQIPVKSYTVYFAVKNGYQCAFMAPTEILAQQHYASLSAMFKDTGVCVGLLTGSTTQSQRTQILNGLVNGEIDVLIGTHAILEENVVFKNLGLVVTDEQHRFGVKQRMKLSADGIDIDEYNNWLKENKKIGGENYEA